MSDFPLYTLRDVAQQLELPESTARYYRDAFAAYIPTVGRGRRRRYPPEAVTVLREIAQAYAAGQSREAIESALGGDTDPEPPRTTAPVPAHLALPVSAQEVLAAVIDGERDRRDVMWQMVREIVRLGEAIERQHVILGGIVEQLADRAATALPAGTPQDVPSEPAGFERHAADLTTKLTSLREELERERELVERLRRSKLELERRASEVEDRLRDREQAPPGSGLLAWLLAHRAPQDSPER